MAETDPAARLEAARRKQAEREQLMRAKAAAKAAPRYVQMPEPTGDAQADAAADLDAVQAGFRERAKDEAARFRLATDSEFWVALCFETREQKEALLRALGLLPLGDKYLDGGEVARIMGVALPPSPGGGPRGLPRIDPTWAAMARKQE